MIERNIKLFKWDNFFAGLWPLSTLVVIYFETVTHSYALAMLVFSLTNLTTTLMEIPTGIFSDKIGRRKTLIFAAVTIFICFFLWALAGETSQAWMLFVGALFWGMSDAFLSGTDEALMYETMEELGKEKDFQLLFSKSGGFNQIGLAVSALSAALITYFFSLQTLAWISVFPILGQLLIAFLYVEPKHLIHKQKISPYKHFLIGFRKLWRNKKLRFYAIIDMIDSSVGTASYRMESAYYETLITPWLINMARFLKQICGTVSFFIVPYVSKIGLVKMFFGSMIGNIIIRLSGVLMNNILTPFLMSTVNIFFGTAKTSAASILQKEFSKSQRATMKSIISLGGGILMALVLYLFGWLADIYSPRFAILTAIIIKIFVAFGSLYILKTRKMF